MWMSEVARKVWMRGREAGWTASQHFSMSPRVARARPQMMGGWPPSLERPTSTATRRTASRSSGEAAGKPASITSMPRRARDRATSNFSALVIVAPGDCSPSRRVVSKMRTKLFGWTSIRCSSCYFGVCQFSGLKERTTFPVCQISDLPISSSSAVRRAL